MAKAKETLQEKKLRRNKEILKQYKELKQTMNCRQAQILLADLFSVSQSTINKVLFVPEYSHSPLAMTVATVQTKSVPV